MRTLSQGKSVWTALMAMLVLASAGAATAQTRYRVIDLGVLHNWNLSCAMALNDYGWTETMNGLMNPVSNFSGAPVVTGHATIDIGQSKIDLGTLGGKNSWMNWGGLNDRGEAVGYAETAVRDPDGEDFCGFGSHRTCLPFLWRNGHMSALPTAGGNNGQASAINNGGQIAGYAETGEVDSTCPLQPAHTTAAIVWEHERAHILPNANGDLDGVAYGINGRGQAVGYSGTCTAATHAVLWTHGQAVVLAGSAIAYAINDHGQVAGVIASANGATFYAALWQDGEVLTLGTLPGDFAAQANSINNRGQVVGSTLDSGYNWAHAFIWQNGVMTDLNTLFLSGSNLHATMANQINNEGEISGMATVRTGPHAGDIHAFLAIPVNGGGDSQR